MLREKMMNYLEGLNYRLCDLAVSNGVDKIHSRLVKRGCEVVRLVDGFKYNQVFYKASCDDGVLFFSVLYAPVRSGDEAVRLWFCRDYTNCWTDLEELVSFTECADFMSKLCVSGYLMKKEVLDYVKANKITTDVTVYKIGGKLNHIPQQTVVEKDLTFFAMDGYEMSMQVYFKNNKVHVM